VDELADSAPWLNDSEELRRRLAADGYLFFRGLLPALAATPGYRAPKKTRRTAETQKSAYCRRNHHIDGGLYAAYATGLITIGDLDNPLSCAGNTIADMVSLQRNTHGVQISDNTVGNGINVVGTTGTLPPPDTGALDMRDNATGPVR
jgi:hypothetical protein